MALSCGIIGLPLVGKTTFFNLLTGANLETSAFLSGKTTTTTGHASVIDPRIDYLKTMFNPKKTTYAQMEVVDVPGLTRGAGNEFLASVRDCDVLAHIVRGFADGQVPHIDDSIDIMRDIATIDSELLLADLQLVETRLDRIKNTSKKKIENVLEEPTLEKCQALLEEEKPLKLLQLTHDEQEAIKHISFLTTKPLLIVVNLDEQQFSSNNYPQQAEIAAYCAAHDYELITVSAQLEEEISQLPEEERQIFLEELKISESGVSRIAKVLYRGLGLVSFFTVGEDEVRAWTIPQNFPAKQAAGKIHSDIERGFIRAETVSFSQLQELGSMAAAREKGCFRLEGKEYPVQDGDIINFRFNV